MTEIVVAVIGALAAITAACISQKQSKKIAHIRKQVSENSHFNDPPTVLDLISDLRNEQRETNRMLVRHLEWHAGPAEAPEKHENGV